jgi:hypothetical protein
MRCIYKYFSESQLYFLDITKDCNRGTLFPELTHPAMNADVEVGLHIFFFVFYLTALQLDQNM